MKSFEQVYKNSKTAALNESKEAAIHDRSVLISAIKKEFYINDLSKCNESEKQKYNKMINEMWSPVSGLNDAGKAFINNSEIILNESTDNELVVKEIKRRLKSNESAILNCVLSGKECAVAHSIKSDVESKIGRKITDRDFKNMLATLVGEYAVKVIKNYKF